MYKRQGLLERVVDVVRAECVAGTGYPYAMETADALAVITLSLIHISEPTRPY